jgi:hypothetical protein
MAGGDTNVSIDTREERQEKQEERYATEVSEGNRARGGEGEQIKRK